MTIQVEVTDGDLATTIVVDDPAAVTVVEVQLPGVQGPPGDGSSADLPSGGSIGQVLVKTGSGDSDITWATPDATQTELDAKLAKMGNGNVALNATTGDFAAFRVAKDANPESGWIDRLSFWFSEDGVAWSKTWFIDKFAQLRARAARDNQSRTLLQRTS